MHCSSSVQLWVRAYILIVVSFSINQSDEQSLTGATSLIISSWRGARSPDNHCLKKNRTGELHYVVPFTFSSTVFEAKSLLPTPSDLSGIIFQLVTSSTRLARYRSDAERKRKRRRGVIFTASAAVLWWKSLCCSLCYNIYFWWCSMIILVRTMLWQQRRRQRRRRSGDTKDLALLGVITLTMMTTMH